MTPKRNLKAAFVGPYIVSGKSILTKSATLAALEDAEEIDSDDAEPAPTKKSDRPAEPPAAGSGGGPLRRRGAMPGIVWEASSATRSAASGNTGPDPWKATMSRPRARTPAAATRSRSRLRRPRCSPTRAGFRKRHHHSANQCW